MKDYCAPRFVEEKLALHWRVDGTKESLERLLYHLEVRSNFKPYFEEALKNLGLDGPRFGDGLVVADIGAGVCWTSALFARHDKVKTVYAVDPSDKRLKHSAFLVRHFEVQDKTKIIKGTFLKPNVPEKVDIVLLCGSLHHCYDDQIPQLFRNIKALLNRGGVVMIASEHYVDWVWGVKRALSWAKHFGDGILHYSLRDLRMPDPADGEHWRTRKELERIFGENGFTAKFFIHKGDLCKDKPTVYHRAGWHYYNAILSSGRSVGEGSGI